MAIPRSVMAAGGMQGVSDGRFMLHGTLGQAVIGIGTANVSRAYHGFWVPIVKTSSVGSNEVIAGNGAFLLSNSPNPFSSSTTISFSVRNRSRVEVAIVDMSGSEVARVMDAAVEPGEHRVIWDGLTFGGEKAPSGVYTCLLTVTPADHSTGGPVQNDRRKLMLVR